MSGGSRNQISEGVESHVFDSGVDFEDVRSHLIDSEGSKARSLIHSSTLRGSEARSSIHSSILGAPRPDPRDIRRFWGLRGQIPETFVKSGAPRG